MRHGWRCHRERGGERGSPRGNSGGVRTVSAGTSKSTAPSSSGWVSHHPDRRTVRDATRPWDASETAACLPPAQAPSLQLEDHPSRPGYLISESLVELPQEPSPVTPGCDTRRRHQGDGTPYHPRCAGSLLSTTARPARHQEGATHCSRSAPTEASSFTTHRASASADINASANALIIPASRSPPPSASRCLRTGSRAAPRCRRVPPS